MVLTWYLCKRFIWYSLIISITLPVLFVVIDCLSRISRYIPHHHTELFLFAAWSFVTNYFDLLPMSSLLATYGFIIELVRKQEFEAIFLCGITPSYLLRFGLLIGMVYFFMGAIVRDQLAYEYVTKARYESLSILRNREGADVHIITKTWMKVSPQLFLYCQAFNLSTHRGIDVTLLHIEQGRVVALYTAPDCRVIKSSTSVQLYIDSGFCTDDLGTRMIAGQCMFSGDDFLLNYDVRAHYSFKQTMCLLLGLIPLSPHNAGYALLRKTVHYYVQLIIMPLSGLAFFMLPFANLFARMALIAVPYIVMRLMAALCEYKWVHMSLLKILCVDLIAIFIVYFILLVIMLASRSQLRSHLSFLYKHLHL